MMWKILPFFITLFVFGLGSSQTGNVHDIDISDIDFQRAEHYAVSVYNSNSEDENIYAVETVLKAQSQVVAGMAYIMTLKMRKTFCTKDSYTGFCPFITSPLEARFIICSFTVVDIPRLGGMRLTDYNCSVENSVGSTTVAQ